MHRLRGMLAGALILLVWAVPGASQDPCGPGFGVAPDDLLQEDGWQCAARQAAVHVFSRRSPGTRIHEVAATSVVDAPLQTVARVIVDYRRYPEFMPYVGICRVEAQSGALAWVFQQLTFPFPISDRYYTIKLAADDPAAAGVLFRVDWQLADDLPVLRKGEGEPVLTNKGFWKLEALENGRRTHVTYFIHTDPGGALPAWIVNLANNAAVPKVIEAVRQRALAAD
jgi:ribosome-associated toxin RatA of RatAB toxin-antitoxin module